MRRAQDGFIDAFEELVSRHGQRVYRTALAMLGNVHDAQDVSQDAFLAAWKAIGGFRGQSSFTTWLYQIITRLSLNHLKRYPGRRDVQLDSDRTEAGPEPAHRVEQQATQDAVSRAISDLPPPQRSVIVLHHLEGLPYAEVAEITHSTVAAVRSNLFRARRTLAQSLQEWR